MAEKFLDILDEKHTSSPSRSFDDFEKEWLDLGTDWALPILEPEYSPIDPYFALTGDDGTTVQIKQENIIPSQTTTCTPVQIQTMASSSAPTTQTTISTQIDKGLTTPKTQVQSEGRTKKRRLSETEDSILLTLLRKNKDETSVPVQTSPRRSVPVQQKTRDPRQKTRDPRQQKKENQHAMEQSILKAFRRNNATKYAALNRRCATPEEPSSQPLHEELEAVDELISCIQADLAQTTILITYVKDYVRKNCKRRIPLQTLS